ncbi:hypothetical protein TNIN_95601 [Trichonephila inaurata madagascariensis]|uniref:Uncharacterized protein n=1 Tax=Trichonephila inaurata madagascariensis TaxID=2747483 RepID=A0A8X6X4F9_9ARAC|nr:hypothetical protein TNIN_95601 [Trichonephila inaurata madagascariensis]
MDAVDAVIEPSNLRVQDQRLTNYAPQLDFAIRSTQNSNCQGLQKLDDDIKGYAINIDGCHKAINELIQAGLTDPSHPVMSNNTKVLEYYNQRYQQALSEFTFYPPCDSPNCTLHTTPNSLPQLK